MEHDPVLRPERSITEAPRTIDVAAIEHEAKALKWATHDRRDEQSVKSNHHARLAAAALAIVVAVGGVRWLWVSIRQFRDESGWSRWVQLGLDIIGIAAAVVATAYVVYFVVTGRRKELFVKSDLIARVASTAVAVVVAVGMARWVWVTAQLFDDENESAWYRWIQLVLSISGIAAAAVATAYFVYFGATDRIWRRWRPAAATFGILAAAWSLLILSNRLAW